MCIKSLGFPTSIGESLLANVVKPLIVEANVALLGVSNALKLGLTNILIKNPKVWKFLSHSLYAANRCELQLPHLGLTFSLKSHGCLYVSHSISHESNLSLSLIIRKIKP